jgi:hypothetical protein
MRVSLNNSGAADFMQWLVEVELCPLSIILYKPLIAELKAGIHKKLSGVEEQPMESLDDSEKDSQKVREEDHLIVKARMRLKKGNLGQRHKWRNECRQFENATKQRLPGGCSTTNMTIRTNGMEVLIVEPFSQNRYLQQRLNMPATVQEIMQRTNAEGHSPRVDAACLLSELQAASRQPSPTCSPRSEPSARPENPTELLLNDERQCTIHSQDLSIEIHTSAAEHPGVVPIPMHVGDAEMQTWMQQLVRLITCPCSPCDSTGGHSGNRTMDSGFFKFAESTINIAPEEITEDWLSENQQTLSPRNFTSSDQCDSSPGFISLEVVRAEDLGLPRPGLALS